MAKYWKHAVLIVFLGTAVHEPVWSQEVRSVTGYIRSAIDSSTLSGVHVSVAGFPAVVLSDQNGRVYFSNLPRTVL